MIIAAALIEGATLFALVVCILLADQGLSSDRRVGPGSGARSAGPPAWISARPSQSLLPYREGRHAMPIVLAAASFIEVRPGLIFWTLVTFVSWPSCCAGRRGAPSSRWSRSARSRSPAPSSRAKRERAEAEKLLAEQKTAIAEARREAAEMMRRNAAGHGEVPRGADGQEPQGGRGAQGPGAARRSRTRRPRPSPR